MYHEVFGEVLAIELGTDSAAGRAIACRRGVGRVRHLEVRQLYLQKLAAAGRVKLVKIKGDANEADLGTKPLDARRLNMLLKRLGYYVCDENLMLKEIELKAKRGKRDDDEGKDIVENPTRWAARDASLLAPFSRHAYVA